MEKNEIIRVKIESIAAGGEGVCRAGGMTVFVENAVPGDELEARIAFVKKNYARAAIHKIINPSPDRVIPPCKYFVQCGACQLQHIKYPAQLEIKKRIIKDAIQRIAGADAAVVKDVIGMEEPWGYRNKMQYPVQRSKGKSQKEKANVKSQVRMGYYRKGTHEVVDIDECIVLHPFLNKIAAAARKALNDNNISVYDEDSGRGLLRHVLARIGFGTGEALLTFIINDKTFHGSNKMLKEIIDILKLDSGGKNILKGAAININTRRTNVILGDRTRSIWGREQIKEKLGTKEFLLSPASFFQINPAQTQKLYGKVLEYGSFAGNEKVIDAYCGTGSIAVWIAGSVKEVVGIEEISDAVSDAKQNARLNNASNVYFRCGKAEKLLQKFSKEGYKPDTVILDPPRTGCEKQALEAILRMAPKKIIYVSCDPATLARDIRILSDKYSVKEIQPVDMFPHTSHVECIAAMSNDK